MQKIFLHFTAILISIFLISCSSSKDTTEQPNGELFKKTTPVGTVKLLSISTNHLLQDKADVKKFAEWVKTTGAEVISIQQIERPTETKPGFDAVQELAKRLDMRMYFGKARYFQGWDSGNALFSIYPIQQANTFALPTGKGRIRRALSYGVIDAGVRAIAFGSTELDEEILSERIKQVFEIFSIAESVKEYPVVVCGLFNESAKGKTTMRMNEKFTAVNTLNDETLAFDQHVYIQTNSKVHPVNVEKIKFNGINGILSTLEIQQ